MNQIYSSLGQLLSSALPAFHALFGNDYTAAFSRKSKVRPFKCLENSEEAKCVFSNLAVDLQSMKEEVIDIEKLMRGFKFFAISTKRKMKISRYRKLKVSTEVVCHLAKMF